MEKEFLINRIHYTRFFSIFKKSFHFFIFILTLCINVYLIFFKQIFVDNRIKWKLTKK